LCQRQRHTAGGRNFATAKLLASLSEKTKPEDIEALATLTEADQERFTTLNKTLAEADPKQKAQDLKLRATRFMSLSTRIGAAIEVINDASIANLKSLIQKSKVAKQAADLAGKQFKETPGLSLVPGERRGRLSLKPPEPLLLSPT
jgi:hypothetical protein